MSIEKALADLTKAIETLTAKIDGVAAQPTPAAKTESEAPKTEAKKEAPKKEVKKETKKAEPEEDLVEDEATDAIPYDDVKKKTLEFVKAKGRDELMAVFSQFGRNVQSAKDLEEGQYADYLKAIDAELAEDDVA